MKKRINLFLTGLVLVIGLTGCNDAKESKTDTTQEVVAGIEEDEVAVNEATAIIYENTSTTTTEVAVQTTEDIPVTTGSVNQATSENVAQVETANQATGENVAQTEAANQATSENVPQTEAVNQTADENYPMSPATDYIPDAYKAVLDSLYTDLSKNPSENVIGQNYYTYGIWEVVNSLELSEERLYYISYCIEDINSDGIEELLILEQPNSKDTYVIDMYTMSGNEVVNVTSGWGRNSYYILDDGIIYNEGSNGAAYAISQLFVLEPGATQLTLQDYYFTYPKNDNYEDIGNYHNTQGCSDPSVSTELESDALLALRRDLKSRIKSFDATCVWNYKN